MSAKKIILLYCATAILVFAMIPFSLSSCAPKETNIGQAADFEPTDLVYTEGHVSGELCEGVSVDTEIPDLSLVSSYDIVSAHLQNPEEAVVQSMKNYIFRGYDESEIQKEYAQEDQHTNYFIAAEPPWYWYAGMAIIEYPGYQRINLENTDAWLSGGSYVNNVNRWMPLADQVGMFTQNELPFMRPADAVKIVQKQLAEWDIKPIGDPEIYCLDHHTLINHNELLIAQQSDTFRPELGAKLDCYFMIFEVGYHNIPYSSFEFRSSDAGEAVMGANLHVYFSADGIINMSYQYANYAIDNVLEKHEEAIPLDQAMSQVKQHYEELIVTSGIHIANIYFEYVPTIDGNRIGRESETAQSILVPAWIIQPATYNMGIEVYLDPIVIHAISGQNITHVGKYG